MTKYPTEKQVYNQILKEIKRRGFGLLLAYTGLGAIRGNEPCWAEVTLVGENHKTYFLHIDPKSIPHFTEPLTDEQRKAMDSGRFVYIDEKRAGLKEIRQSIKQHLPSLYPELTETKLYLLDLGKINPAAEYWSEVEETIREKYNQSLEEFLSSTKLSRYCRIQ